MITNAKYISAPLTVIALLFSASACSDPSTMSTDTAKVEVADSKQANNIQTSDSSIPDEQVSTNKPAFTTKIIASFDEPWAMTALPKSSAESLKLLVTQKTGELFVVDARTGVKARVSGVPKVAYGGQGGLGDVILAPDFATTNIVYLSYIEAGKGSEDNTFGAKVIKAKLSGLDTTVPTLQAIVPIWQQRPKVKGQGHYSHRLLFSPDGRYLYISSGERQAKDPAQDMSVNLGKIVRLNPDGTVPIDNPFVHNSNVDTEADIKANANDITKQLWTLGHRNVLGMAFDKSGRLWAHEMGPRGGDELNLIEKGSNYGWPIVSNGRNYSGIDIPDHDTRPDFIAPKITWTPVISPSSMSLYYSGSYNDFPAWQGNALISGLSSKALIVVDLGASNAAAPYERYRYDMGQRIRSVLAVDGEVWLLEDGSSGKLLRLLPK
ncbi:PQQ-dependent sugar dehydrogenase [Psychrobacter sp. CAL346-MNA-CIBAN-0220]|uniref:PQQ-dependent sugar dehydrogenase n=1 Tax=Psychrobacter sp. CAL346-MNA-CIBAN-0220 TaxID=3140457 RepID=UPI00387E2C1E